jgi:putative spermidine/putrescine transport system permease protein
LTAIFVVPVGRMIVLSFRGSSGGWPSLNTYRALATHGFFTSVFLQTLALGIVVTALCLVIGYPLAWKYVYSTSRLRAVILFIVAAPLLINTVVRVYGWTVILRPGGFIDRLLAAVGVHSPPQLMYNYTGVVIGMVHILLPFMVLSLAPAITRLDPKLYEAARVLGSGVLRRHRTITLPLTTRGINAGVVLVFALTQGLFLTPLLLGGASVRVTASEVYTKALVLFDLPGAAAVATTLLVVVLLLVTLQGRLTARQGRTA